jgi:hypothetical protein
MQIGLIAGNGQFPLLFLKKAKEKGYTVCVAALKNETDPEIEKYADKIQWLHIGQVKKLIKFFRSNEVSQAVMAGAVKKVRVFRDIKPDLKAVAFLARMKHTHDDGILSSFADLMDKEKITIKASTFLLPELLADKGLWTKSSPNLSQEKDIEAGWEIVKKIGDMDIGQCIVIENGTVLAVEAVDGTDSTIIRGGSLGNKSAVLIKLSKPNQDMRFDVPAVGLTTIETMHKSGVKVLVVEAGKAVVFDKKEMVDYANSHGMVIIAR